MLHEESCWDRVCGKSASPGMILIIFIFSLSDQVIKEIKNVEPYSSS